MSVVAAQRCAGARRPTAPPPLLQCRHAAATRARLDSRVCARLIQAHAVSRGSKGGAGSREHTLKRSTPFPCSMNGSNKHSQAFFKQTTKRASAPTPNKLFTGATAHAETLTSRNNVPPKKNTFAHLYTYLTEGGGHLLDRLGHLQTPAHALLVATMVSIEDGDPVMVGFDSTGGVVFEEFADKLEAAFNSTFAKKVLSSPEQLEQKYIEELDLQDTIFDDVTNNNDGYKIIHKWLFFYATERIYSGLRLPACQWLVA